MKDYLHGKLTPTEAATRFVENLTWCNSCFQGLQCLAVIAWDVSDSRGQINSMYLYGIFATVGHSKREMDLRGENELTPVLDEFSLSILDEHDGNYSRVLPS